MQVSLFKGFQKLPLSNFIFEKFIISIVVAFLAMKVIKHTSRKIEQTVKVSTIQGKKVLTKDGRKIGTLKNIHIDPKNLSIEGVHVKGGIFGTDRYIGKGYIQSMTEQGVILSIVPVEEYIGLSVFDSRGKKIGKVWQVQRSRKTNTLVGIIVDRGLFGGKKIAFSGKHIKTLGKNIVLKVAID
jgi:sporulation protein YlmC with PRC-barrel domain